MITIPHHPLAEAMSSVETDDFFVSVVEENYRERYSPTEEDFLDDSPAAEARAVELGKTHNQVALIALGMFDTDTHLAAYGLTVRHECRHRRLDRRGEWCRQCGSWLKDDAALICHLGLAGVPNTSPLEDQ